MRSVSSSCGSMNDVGLVGKVYRVRRPLVSQRRMVEGSRSQRVAASLTVMRSWRRLVSVSFMGVPYLAVHARATRALVRIGMHGWACAAWRVRRRSVAPPSRLLRGWVRVWWSRPRSGRGSRSALVRGLWWSHVDRGASSCLGSPCRCGVRHDLVCCRRWRARFRAVDGGMRLDPSGIWPEGVAWRCTTG